MTAVPHPAPDGAIATFLARRNIHYGWFIVGVTFLVMLATAGAMGAPGVLIEPLQKEFGWTNADISAAMALRLGLFGLMAPFSAALINRFGVRPVALTALALIISGIVGSLLMTKVWHLVALWGIVIGIGTGMTAMVLGATVATRWFSHRRGLVVGMLTASNATGQLVFLPLLATLTTTFGWRTALATVVCVLFAAAALVAFFMRDRPSDVGLPPYGETEIVPAPANRQTLPQLVSTPLTTLRDAARTPIFWVLFLTFYVCGLSTNGLIQTHWITLCGDFGVAPVGAAGILAVIGIFDFIGTILSGWLSDRYDNRWLLFWYYGLRGLSLIFLPSSDFSVMSLSIFAVFYGLDWVATVPPTVQLTAQRFGREKANVVFGWVFCGHQIGAASAAWGAGFARTDFLSYLPALYVAGFACLAASMLVLTVRKQPRPAAA
ncbi:MFS transporter [uncultured Alsobacter sp.]|uniref:MFS transporter n=1 Tax=uncultured Alsobacter sp. TaxID=1748258 RepID=UPI0025D55385|nr:MFS transporter [uncultured Alsobacter sp.]